MLKRMLERSWKGFFTRYITILLILLAINYMVQNKETIFGGPVQDDTVEVNTNEDHLHLNEDAADVDQGTAPKPQMEVSYKLTGSDLQLSFELKHFELSLDRMDKGNKYGEGHIHLYVDGQKVTKIFENEYTLKGLSTGKHEIKIELAHNNHEPYGIDQVFTLEVK